MNYDAEVLRDRIDEMCTHILFEFNGKDCGIDPLSKEHIDMWCGQLMMTAKGIDEAMAAPFFDGKSLRELAGTIPMENL